jgi:predicted transport protein
MTFQAYLDNVQAKTGKTVADFRLIAAEKGIVKKSDLITWLKADFALGHGHANAIAHAMISADAPKVTEDEQIAAHFTGKKAAWRAAYDALIAYVSDFGDDVATAPTQTYISLLRGRAKFAIVQPSTERLDIGIKLKGVAATDRLEAAGTWNAMVTHRVRISDPAQIDDEVRGWLRRAYDAV